ncbi:peptidoglycan-binding domain-containing protein [Streptomyces spiramyceticus]|uniref:peptidoglycan-binding domain-containing protein n=1 Tax=Streptomyces spiramyceticus TaxID=299717 RepID=UPI00237A7369|nr:peptidoglycan-binding domain-containing protein [Streptomyces spiramyceticus]
MFARHRVALATAAVFGALAMSVAPAVAHSPQAAAPVSAVQLAPPAYCGYYDGTATTQRGDSGNRVREVQCLINYWSGSDVLAIDGAFGPRTESWVVHFQDVNGLRVDGIVGPQTWDALRAL